MLISQLLWIVSNQTFTILETGHPCQRYRTCAKHLLPSLTAALVCNLAVNVLGRCSATAAGAHSHTNIMARWRSNSGREQKKEKAGFTHLTTGADQKLLWLHYPNSHLWRMSRRTVGEGERGERKDKNKKKKIKKDRSGMVVKAETQLNDVYQTKPFALARVQVKRIRNSLNR